MSPRQVSLLCAGSPFALFPSGSQLLAGRFRPPLVQLCQAYAIQLVMWCSLSWACLFPWLASKLQKPHKPSEAVLPCQYLLVCFLFYLFIYCPVRPIFWSPELQILSLSWFKPLSLWWCDSNNEKHFLLQITQTTKTFLYWYLFTVSFAKAMVCILDLER